MLYPKLGQRIATNMVKQGITVAKMADLVGMEASKVSTIRCGYTMPRQEHLIAFAHALHDPLLMDIASEYLKTSCSFCKKDFTRNPSFQRGDQKFCSTRCRTKWWNEELRRERKVTRNGRIISARRSEAEAKHRADVLEQDLDAAKAAIAEFCRRCEWDQTCKDDTCELRALSPFPLGKAMPMRVLA